MSSDCPPIRSAGEPTWMPLYDPKFAELDFEAGGDDDPTPVGVLLCSFELRAYQPPKSLESTDPSKSAAIVDLSSQVMSSDCLSNRPTECL